MLDFFVLLFWFQFQLQVFSPSHMLNCKINGTVHIFFLKKYCSAPGERNCPNFFSRGAFPSYHHVISAFRHIWGPFMAKIEKCVKKVPFWLSQAKITDVGLGAADQYARDKGDLTNYLNCAIKFLPILCSESAQFPSINIKYSLDFKRNIKCLD